MKKIFIVIISLIFMGRIYGQNLPKLNQSWDSSENEKNKTFFIPSGIHPLTTINIDNIDFLIVSENKKIRFISTNNDKFEIGNKKYIGLKLADFKNKSDVKLYRGWGYYLPIDKEWYAYFYFDRLTDSSKVLSVFKYQF